MPVGRNRGHCSPLNTLLISDLHLSPERPLVTVAFLDFLARQASQCEALYILGDLFEAWIGDDDPAPLARQIITALKAFSDSGPQLYFLHGNRDFAIGKRFAKETGCTLLDEYHVADFYGNKVLLLHGDTLCTEDREYQRARRFIRNPFLLAFMTRLPLKTRQQIALRGRAKSLASTNKKADYIMDVSQAAVCEALNAYQVDTMIHGHTHRPADHEVNLDSTKTDLGNNQARRIVLGDWHDRGWFVAVSPDKKELCSFAL